MITGGRNIVQSLLRLPRAWPALPAVIALALGISTLFAVERYRQSSHWRRWMPDDIAVSFWAWHADAPAEGDVLNAVHRTRARTLFLRAGQIDLKDGKLVRIREVTGHYPTGIDIHLVYNATRSCLAEFERLDATGFAKVLRETYETDAGRAASDGARVAGIQLDFDVPTRLLGEYKKLLSATREQLPRGLSLSITGLVTWMDSRALSDTLSAVDFWIPQCYGATIPESLGESQTRPISSLNLVDSAIARARSLNRPFYAGLAAYGYAIQYSQNGTLIGLRGDLDPGLVTSDSSFDLISRAAFSRDEARETTGRWRCVYRARNDDVIGGTAVHRSDYLMLDIPTAASLREAARIAREQGGDKLLGVCVFRLPRRDDPTSLTIEEVARALAGDEPASSFQIETKVERERSSERGVASRLRLRIVNDGSARSRPDAGAIGLSLKISPASVKTIRIEGFSSVESYAEVPEFDSYLNATSVLRPCSLSRARVLTFSAKQWRPGQEATAVIGFARETPEKLSAGFEVTLDDGKMVRQSRTIDLRAAK